MLQVNQEKGVLITAEVVGDHVNMLVAGELNSNTAAQFETELTKVVNQGSCRLSISLENVSLITSAGLRVLLVTAKALLRREGDIVLYGCTPNVAEVFELTGFDSIIKLKETYEDAVYAIGGSISQHQTGESFEAATAVYH